LSQKYRERGLEVLAFPCNQFGGQEPGSDAEVKAFAESKCPDTLRVFSKLNVNGNSASPLFTYLKQAQGGTFGQAIMWNFTKFLVDRGGKVVARFGPQQGPLGFEDKIAELL